MISNFSTYIKENIDDDFKIGDKVVLRGNADERELDGLIGTIDNITYDSDVHTNIFNGEIVAFYRYFGKLYYIEEINWWVSPHNMRKIKDFKKIENPEIDPYGEEDWGWKIEEI